jgi:cell division protein FtsB
MWMQGLQPIFLGLSAYERWNAARGAFGTSFGAEPWLTWFAIVCLITAVILLLWVYTKRARTEKELRNTITDSTITIFKLRQEKDELAAANKKLQQAIAELSEGQAAILQNMKSR